MIYSGKTTSVKVVIAKLYRDLDLKEEDLFINFLEWSAEALEKIGAFTQLETKSCDPIEINNFKGELPTDIVYINQVSFNGYPILPASNSFGPIKIENNGSPSNAPYAFYEDKIQNTVFVNPADSGLYTLNKGLYERVTYSIGGGCIKTSFCNGFLEISYQAMPIDEEGYPLVPDYVEFREALYWYINMKYSYSMWRRGEIRDGIYQHAQEQWHWYCQQAANKAIIPDLSTLESIKRSFLCLHPKVEQFRNFFNDLNKTNNKSTYHDRYY